MIEFFDRAILSPACLAIGAQSNGRAALVFGLCATTWFP
jgi:hypothetical protein